MIRGGPHPLGGQPRVVYIDVMPAWIAGGLAILLITPNSFGVATHSFIASTHLLAAISVVITMLMAALPGFIGFVFSAIPLLHSASRSALCLVCFARLRRCRSYGYWQTSRPTSV